VLFYATFNTTRICSLSQCADTFFLKSGIELIKSGIELIHKMYKGLLFLIGMYSFDNQCLQFII